MTTALETTAPGAVVPADVSAAALQSALAGDLSRLTEPDRLKFYGRLCEFTGLNPLSKPFDWLMFQGKLTLYANKGCAEQLRKIHKVNITILERGHEKGVYWVRARFTDGDGREDESIAAVPLPDNAAPDARAMAMMKAETKVKRRGTFSICGLSLIVKRDEDVEEPAPGKVSHTVTATDRAEALNAEVVATSPDERSNLIAEIQSTIKAAIPGTDAGSQRAKADALQKAFGVRSWTVIEALPVEKLKAGMAGLTAALMQFEPEPMTLEAEPVVETPKPVAPEPPKPTQKPLVLKPTPPAPVQQTPAPAPAPEEPPFDTAPNTLPDDVVTQLETIIGEHGPTASNWLLKEGWLQKGQGLESLTPERAQKIINRPAQFIRAVTVNVR